jgi:cytochrome b pre-mRNA-processing protein 3
MDLLKLTMTILSRLFARQADPRDRLRPLWHALIAWSRQPRWYAELGVADTVPGRFDMLSATTVLALLRFERDPALAQEAVLLTELFIEDMDGQLRESGIGDVVVGKHVGRLMSVLGGRLGAFREALAAADEDALADAVRRNMTMIENADPAALAAALRAEHARFAALDAEAFLAGNLA